MGRRKAEKMVLCAPHCVSVDGPDLADCQGDMAVIQHKLIWMSKPRTTAENSAVVFLTK